MNILLILHDAVSWSFAGEHTFQYLLLAVRNLRWATASHNIPALFVFNLSRITVSGQQSKWVGIKNKIKYAWLVPHTVPGIFDIKFIIGIFFVLRTSLLRPYRKKWVHRAAQSTPVVVQFHLFFFVLLVRSSTCPRRPGMERFAYYWASTRARVRCSSCRRYSVWDNDKDSLDVERSKRGTDAPACGMKSYLRTVGCTDAH